MTEEEKKNKEKRKTTPLTIEEWFTFFFIPIKNIGSKLFPAKEFNQTEEERFKKHGFEKKLKQLKIAKLLGIIFYIEVIIALLIFK